VYANVVGQHSANVVIVIASVKFTAVYCNVDVSSAVYVSVNMRSRKTDWDVNNMSTTVL